MVLHSSRVPTTGIAASAVPAERSVVPDPERDRTVLDPGDRMEIRHQGQFYSYSAN